MSSEPKYVPTSEEIEAATKKLRESWTEQQHRKHWAIAHSEDWDPVYSGKYELPKAPHLLRTGESIAGN